jgi:hypothetical protein
MGDGVATGEVAALSHDGLHLPDGASARAKKKAGLRQLFFVCGNSG